MNYEEYVQDNVNELEAKFAEKKIDEFAEFCIEEYNEAIRDHSDMLLDQERDRKLEESMVKK